MGVSTISRADGEGQTGVVYRIQYGAVTPTITAHPESRTVTTGKPVTFSVRASGPPPLRYQWQRNGANITGATARDYTIASVGAADQGASFRAVVRNDFGNVLSNAAVLTVTANRAPTAAMSQPATGALYSAGNVIAYTGTATDPEDGTLPRERVHLEGGLPSRHSLASIHSADDRLAHRFVLHSEDGRDRRPTCGIAFI